jgi:hypothetical protein
MPASNSVGRFARIDLGISTEVAVAGTFATALLVWILGMLQSVSTRRIVIKDPGDFGGSRSRKFTRRRS